MTHMKLWGEELGDAGDGKWEGACMTCDCVYMACMYLLERRGFMRINDDNVGCVAYA